MCYEMIFKAINHRISFSQNTILIIIPHTVNIYYQNNICRTIPCQNNDHLCFPLPKIIGFVYYYLNFSM